MTAFFQDWTMVAGDSRTLRFTVTGDDGAVADLTGASSVRWGCVRRLANGSFVAPPAVTKTLGTGVTLVDPSGGIIEVTLSPADTAALPGGRYYHQLELTSAAGGVATLATGTLTLAPDLLT